jgi:CubicO group peptidase (beta-lactamase class C family)
MVRIGELREQLQADLSRLATEHEVPGASVALLVDGETADASTGVVNLRTGVETTPDAVFMIQSITKVWTATLVMQLVDEGRVDLDAPVTTYLPGFRTADERVSRAVTVRHLLAHTGGFEGDLWAPTTSGDDALERFVDDLVPRAPQHSPPGELFSYCSAGYGVLGRLVEVLREMRYEPALRRHLAAPLGIDEIAFCADEALSFRTAIGHGRPSPTENQRPLNAWAVMPPSNPAAGNQLAMSARGLLAFARMHLAGGLAADGTRVLSETSVRAMQEREIDHPASSTGRGHGLGWMLSETPVVAGHGGGTIGISAMLCMVPASGVAAAVLTNGDSGSALIGALLDPLLGELAGIEKAPARSAPDASSRVAVPETYLGRYQTRVTRHDVTQDDDGRLWLVTSPLNEAQTMAGTAGVEIPSERHEMRAVGGSTFVLIESSGEPGQVVEFIGQDEAGRARLLHTGRAAPRAG